MGMPESSSRPIVVAVIILVLAILEAYVWTSGQSGWH